MRAIAWKCIVLIDPSRKQIQMTFINEFSSQQKEDAEHNKRWGRGYRRGGKTLKMITKSYLLEALGDSNSRDELSD